MRLLWAFFLLIAPIHSFADKIYLPSYSILSYEQFANSRIWGFYNDLALADGKRLLLSLSQSSSNIETNSGETEQKILSYSIGIGSDPLETWSLYGSVDSMGGAESPLARQGASGGLTYSSRDFSLGLMLSGSLTQAEALAVDKVEYANYSYGLFLDYALARNWNFVAGGMAYVYPDFIDPSLVDEATWSLVSTDPRAFRVLILDYFRNRYSFGLKYLSTTYYADDYTLELLSLRMRLTFNKVSAHFSIGQYLGEEDSDLYSSLGLGYEW